MAPPKSDKHDKDPAVQFLEWVLESSGPKKVAVGSYRVAVWVVLWLIYTTGQKTWNSIQSIPNIVERLEKVEKALISKGIMSAAVASENAVAQEASNISK